MNDKNDLSSSLEDYLEAILELQELHSVARVKDIADMLNVKRSSVTIALRALSEKNMVNYAPYSVITLTNEGYEVARSIRNRHDLLKKLFTELFAVDLEIAEKSACRMEHGMTKEVYRSMSALCEVLDENLEMKDKIREEILKKVESTENLDPTELPLLIDLNGCQPGDSGVIRKILGSGVAKKRYMEMGLTMGQQVKLVKAAPLDDPIEIQVRNYRLSLRRAEAENILIEREA